MPSSDRREINTRMAATLLAILILFVVIMLAVSGCEPSKDGKPLAEKKSGGRVENHPKSIQSIHVFRSWSPDPKRAAGKAYTLGVGDATSQKVDTDGFCLIDYPAQITVITHFIGTSTTNTTRRPGECLKIQDNQMAIVRVVRSLSKENA